MTEGGEVEPASSTADPQELAGPLPDAVRSRVVALASDALGRIPSEHLPAALKRVSSFAPGKRAKLAGTQIVTVLEADDEFRDRLATQVRASVPEVAAALDSGTPLPAADPVEVAAVAYLTRPDGWPGVVEIAVEAVLSERESEAVRQSVDQLGRLRRRVASLTEELKQASQRHRDERRLRARLEELEGEPATLRRAARAEPGAGALRARLLLDTLLETAQGLRRELALPSVEGAPAATATTSRRQPGPSSRWSSSGTDSSGDLRRWSPAAVPR